MGDGHTTTGSLSRRPTKRTVSCPFFLPRWIRTRPTFATIAPGPTQGSRPRGTSREPTTIPEPFSNSKSSLVSLLTVVEWRRTVTGRSGTSPSPRRTTRVPGPSRGTPTLPVRVARTPRPGRRPCRRAPSDAYGPRRTPAPSHPSQDSLLPRGPSTARYGHYRGLWFSGDHTESVSPLVVLFSRLKKRILNLNLFYLNVISCRLTQFNNLD